MNRSMKTVGEGGEHSWKRSPAANGHAYFLLICADVRPQSLFSRSDFGRARIVEEFPKKGDNKKHHLLHVDVLCFGLQIGISSNSTQKQEIVAAMLVI